VLRSEESPMQSYLKLVAAQARLFWREPIALFFTIIFPALLLILLGIVFGNGNQPFEGTTFGYIDLQVPALAGIIVGTVALNAIPVTTANNRERGILRRFKATPMPAWKWIASEITVNFIIALLSMALLIVIATYAFNMRFAGNWWAVAAGFALSAFSFMALGYVVASLSPTPRVATAAGQILYFPMFMLSGAAIPLMMMPDGVQSVAQWLPMTHVVILLQTLWFGGGWAMTSVWVLIAMLIAGGVLSARLFRWE
jgi:ABC-2 type transport system permease protein